MTDDLKPGWLWEVIDKAIKDLDELPPWAREASRFYPDGIGHSPEPEAGRGRMTTLREAIARALYTDIMKDIDPIPDINEGWSDWLPSADAALAAIEAAGWQCVPKEPTREMNIAVNGVNIVRTPCIEGVERTTVTFVTFGEFEAMWELALAAAPKPGGEHR